LTIVLYDKTGNGTDPEAKTKDITDQPAGDADGVRDEVVDEAQGIQDENKEDPGDTQKLEGYEGARDETGAVQDDGVTQAPKDEKNEDSSGKSGHGPRRFCELDIPYPEPRVVERNLYYAKLLLDDYSGPASELTAVHQYLYHYFTLDKEYPDVAELEECIAIVEMRHMELLAETILLLGGDPRFWYIRFRPVYWNASLPYYGRGICDRLRADIAAEEEAIKNYRKHQEMIDDPHIKALLERIIMDEQHHLKLFRQAYERYCPNGAGKAVRRRKASVGLQRTGYRI